jgi:hypothetical protein
VSTVTNQAKSESGVALKHKRGLIRRLLRVVFWCFLVLILALVISRPFLPGVVRWYVNRALHKSILYEGKIGDVELHLWRGAYSIRNIRLSKTAGNIPVPLFSAKNVDLAVQWSALLHGRIVGQIEVNEPEVNFVDDPDPDKSETGSGGPWLQIISSLFPFDINSVKVLNGSVHFRTFAKQKPVDVYLSQLNANVDDLKNISDSVTPLLTTVHADALAMDQAKLELLMKLDPFSYDPTFHLNVRLLGLDITQTNDLVEAYGGFDIKRGLFDLVIDVDCNEGAIVGYIKPLFRNMVIFNLPEDVKDDDVLRVFWQAIVGGTAAVLTNYSRDQLGTLIPFTGDLKGPQIDYLGTIGNVLKNAFIRAYLPRLEKKNTDHELDFGAPSITDPISIGSDP